MLDDVGFLNDVGHDVLDDVGFLNDVGFDSTNQRCCCWTINRLDCRWTRLSLDEMTRLEVLTTLHAVVVELFQELLFNELLDTFQWLFDGC